MPLCHLIQIGDRISQANIKTLLRRTVGQADVYATIQYQARLEGKRQRPERGSKSRILSIQFGVAVELSCKSQPPFQRVRERQVELIIRIEARAGRAANQKIS